MVALSTYPTDDRSTTTLRSPAAISCVTAVENSDRSGYIRRDSPIRTTATPFAFSVVRFISVSGRSRLNARPVMRHRTSSLEHSSAPTRPCAACTAPPALDRLLVLQPFELPREFQPA